MNDEVIEAKPKKKEMDVSSGNKSKNSSRKRRRRIHTKNSHVKDKVKDEQYKSRAVTSSITGNDHIKSIVKPNLGRKGKKEETTRNILVKKNHIAKPHTTGSRRKYKPSFKKNGPPASVLSVDAPEFIPQNLRERKHGANGSIHHQHEHHEPVLAASFYGCVTATHPSWASVVLRTEMLSSVKAQLQEREGESESTLQNKIDNQKFDTLSGMASRKSHSFRNGVQLMTLSRNVPLKIEEGSELNNRSVNNDADSEKSSQSGSDYDFEFDTVTCNDNAPGSNFGFSTEKPYSLLSRHQKNRLDKVIDLTVKSLCSDMVARVETMEMGRVYRDKISRLRKRWKRVKHSSSAKDSIDREGAQSQSTGPMTESQLNERNETSSNGVNTRRPYSPSPLLREKVDEKIEEYDEIESVTKTSLLKACHDGNIRVLCDWYGKVLQRNGNIKSELNSVEKHLNEHGNSLLVAAIAGSSVATVRTLLEWGLNPMRLRYGAKSNPLHEACIRSQSEILYELLNFTTDAWKQRGNFSINDKNSDGQTPLHVACESVSYLEMHKQEIGDAKECIRYLIDAGANIHVRDKQGRTPLHLAAKVGDLDVFNCILKSSKKKTTGNGKLGKDIFCKDSQGHLPLDIAAGMGHDTIVAELIKLGGLAQGNMQTNKALSLAVSNNHLETTRLLIERGAFLKQGVSQPLQSVHIEHLSLLHLAARKGLVSMCKLLLELSDQCNLDLHVNLKRTTFPYDTPFMEALTHGRWEVAETMLNCYGADVSVVNGNEESSLSAALQHTYVCTHARQDGCIKEDLHFRPCSHTTTVPFNLLEYLASRCRQRKGRCVLNKLLHRWRENFDLEYVFLSTTVRTIEGKSRAHSDLVQLNKQYLEYVKILLVNGENINELFSTDARELLEHVARQMSSILDKKNQFNVQSSPPTPTKAGGSVQWCMDVYERRGVSDPNYTPVYSHLAQSFEALLLAADFPTHSRARDDRCIILLGGGGGEKLHAHASILSCRCQMFAAMLRHSLVEASSRVIDLRAYPASAITALIEYIYKGSIEQLELRVRDFVKSDWTTWKNTQLVYDMLHEYIDLLLVADQFLLSHLKRICASAIGVLLHYHMVQGLKRGSMGHDELLDKEIIASVGQVAGETGCMMLARQCKLIVSGCAMEETNECLIHLSHPVLCPCPYPLVTSCKIENGDLVGYRYHTQDVAVKCARKRIGFTQLLSSDPNTLLSRKILGNTSVANCHTVTSMELAAKVADFTAVMALHERTPELLHWLPGEYLLSRDLSRMFSTPDLYFPDLELIIESEQDGNGSLEVLKVHSSVVTVRSGWFSKLISDCEKYNYSEVTKRLTLDLTHVSFDGSFGESDFICSSAWRQVHKFEEALTCCFENSIGQLRALGKTDYLHTLLSRKITKSFPQFWHIEALYCGALIDIAVNSEVKKCGRIAKEKNHLLSKVVGDLTRHLGPEDDLNNQILAPLVLELKSNVKESTTSRVYMERALCVVSALSILCR